MAPQDLSFVFIGLSTPSPLCPRAHAHLCRPHHAGTTYLRATTWQIQTESATGTAPSALTSQQPLPPPNTRSGSRVPDPDATTLLEPRGQGELGLLPPAGRPPAPKGSPHLLQVVARCQHDKGGDSGYEMRKGMGELGRRLVPPVAAWRGRPCYFKSVHSAERSHRRS